MSSYLRDMAVTKNWVAHNYVSAAGKGRNYAIRQLYHQRANYSYVFKTDVKSYFASVDTVILEKLIFKMGVPSCLHSLIWQDLLLSVEKNTKSVREKSIFQGSSMSTFYAWLYLKDLDDFFNQQTHIFYQRYVDDIIILTHTKSALDEGKDTLYSILRRRKLRTRYPKTFEGRTSAPIAYLGYRLHKTQIKQSYESKRKNKKFIMPQGFANI